MPDARTPHKRSFGECRDDRPARRHSIEGEGSKVAGRGQMSLSAAHLTNEHDAMLLAIGHPI